ncbi:MAG TPA: AAA family ATPase [Ktedonobacterales bacterium]
MSAVSPSAFGLLLRRLRQAAGLTQEELAERASLSVEGISALERGVNRAPRRDTITLLASALALSDADLAALVSAARHPDAAASPATGTQTPDAGGQFVGRTAELALLDAHLTGVGSPLLMLSGEAGIGKSRLAREAAARATSAGWTVLAGGCQRQATAESSHSPYDGQDPYAPFVEAIGRHLAAQPAARRKTLLAGSAWLVRLLPELAPMVTPPVAGWTLAPQQERRLIFAAVARYFANVAGPPGTLLLLDDLHWAGADTLDLLRYLIHMPGLPLRVVGTYRDTDVQPGDPLAGALADLAAAGLVRRCALAPLASDDAGHLLSSLVVDADPVLRERVVARAGGVPFFLVSCAQALRAGALSDADGGVGGGAVPWDVAQSIRQRVAVLPDAARRLLSVAAIAGGREVSRAVLLEALGEPAETAVEALEAACQARLLAEMGSNSYGFAHDLIREGIGSDLSAARRAAIHRRLAETIERQPGMAASAPELLAYHFTRAGERERAAVYLELAGDRAAAMRAYAEAEDAYRALIATQEELGRTGAAAAAGEKLGGVLRVAARYDEALAVLERAVSMARTAHDVEQLGRVMAEIGRTHANQGSAALGVQRLVPLLAAPEAAALTPVVHAALYDALAQLYNLSGRYDEQLDAAVRAGELAREGADAILHAQVALRRGSALRMLGRMEEARVVLEQAIVSAEASGDHQNLSYALENASVVYLFRGAIETSDNYLARALALAEEVGDPLAVGLMTMRRGINRCISGAWLPAREDFERARRVLAPIGASWAGVYAPLGLGQLCLMTGDHDAATVHLEHAIALASEIRDLQALRWAQSALAERELLRGAAEAARDRLLPLRDQPGQQESLVTYLLPYLAWAHLELGEASAADALLDECLRRARAEHLHLALVEALRVRALRDLRRGDHEAAREAIAEVLALSRAMPYPHAEAKARYTAGLIERDAGLQDAARDHFSAARDLLDRLGERMYRPLVEAALASMPRSAGD